MNRVKNKGSNILVSSISATNSINHLLNPSSKFPEARTFSLFFHERIYTPITKAHKLHEKVACMPLYASSYYTIFNISTQLLFLLMLIYLSSLMRQGIISLYLYKDEILWGKEECESPFENKASSKKNRNRLKHEDTIISLHISSIKVITSHFPLEI